MNAKQELARVELLKVEALIHQHVLCAPVELPEEFVLVQLIDNKELLSEPSL